jgi:FtsZ-interacting cell division protein YlmF
MLQNKKAWIIAGAVALAGLYLWSRKKKTATPTTIEEEVEAVNNQVSSSPEQKKILDDLYLAYAKNWGQNIVGTKPSASIQIDAKEPDYRMAYEKYKCALVDLQNMSVDELQKALDYHTGMANLQSADNYRIFADLSQKYPKAFQDNPCSSSEKPII